ncbi:HAD family phosphatase [Paenibacillus sp. P22]|uniref:HAD family hydrolase n=1 Tax=Paenibacillus TaxID=44249 RepID=UPI0003F74E1B|nr:HAD family phosphatase [Paenibacillus sp. P22]
MIKAFLFDMDGVIIDSEPLHFDVDIRVMAYLGAEITQTELEPYVGMTNPAMWKAIKEQYGFPHSTEEIIDYQLKDKLQELDKLDIEPIEGIRELLDELRSHGVAIGLASSSPRVFIEAVLGKFGLADYFGCIVSGEEVPQGKPAPDVYLEAASVLGIQPADCVVLEDSRNGVRAAKAAGMRAIGFINPNSGNQDLSEADFTVERIGDIKLAEL